MTAIALLPGANDAVITESVLRLADDGEHVVWTRTYDIAGVPAQTQYVLTDPAWLPRVKRDLLTLGYMGKLSEVEKVMEGFVGMAVKVKARTGAGGAQAVLIERLGTSGAAR